MNFLLNISPDDYGTKNLLSEAGFLDTLTFGLQMLLIGIVAVFSVLGLLWFCLYLFRVFCHDLPAKKASAKTQPEVAEPTPVATPATDDAEIVAVIAAAIAAAESENSGLKFRVVSFRRK